jgi:uncharacterized protein YndB with AHSA1/START domain
MPTYHIHLEAMIDAAPADVWRALTEPELIARWLMQNDFAAEEERSFTLRDKPRMFWDGIVKGRVLEVDEPRRLTYTWTDTSDMPETVVSWFLQPRGEGTKVMLSHTGFRGLKNVVLGRLLERGWKDMLENGLPAVTKDERAARQSRADHD